MSMFSCLGQEALALRDNFVTRLSARTEVIRGFYGPSSWAISDIRAIT